MQTLLENLGLDDYLPDFDEVNGATLDKMTAKELNSKGLEKDDFRLLNQKRKEFKKDGVPKALLIDGGVRCPCGASAVLALACRCQVRLSLEDLESEVA